MVGAARVGLGVFWVGGVGFYEFYAPLVRSSIMANAHAQAPTSCISVAGVVVVGGEGDL